MREPITRAAALAALRKYNHEPFHIQHALTVEGVMRWYAQQLGYGDEADFWATVGLLHDIDFEQWPEQHCQKAPELLREAGCGDDLIRAVCSHGYGICCDIEPTHQMEKVLYAADELTGLIGAAALMRPSKSCPGHGGQEPEEEVQGQEVCRRVLPGCDPAGGRPPGLDPGGADGKDHPGHAQLRGFRKRRHGDPVIQAQPPEIRRLCSFLLTFSFWADTIMF